MRQLFIPLCKVLGLYVLYTGLTFALTMLPVVVSLLTVSDDPTMSQTLLRIFGTSMTLTGISYAAVLLLTAVAAWVLLGKTGWLADTLGLSAAEALAPVSAPVLLPAGIKLVGLYVFVQGLPDFARALFFLLPRSSHGLYLWPAIIPPLLRIALGLVLVLKTSFFLRFAGKDANLG